MGNTLGNNQKKGGNPSAELYNLKAVNRLQAAIDAGTLTLADIINLLTPVQRTHTYITSSTTGSVQAGTLRGSVFNAGDANGLWNGIAIPPGASVSWGHVGINDTYNVVNFDARGTLFMIEYTL